MLVAVILGHQNDDVGSSRQPSLIRVVERLAIDFDLAVVGTARLDSSGPTPEFGFGVCRGPLQIRGLRASRCARHQHRSECGVVGRDALVDGFGENRIHWPELVGQCELPGGAGKIASMMTYEAAIVRISRGGIG
ncbi:hypothetical protein [Pendulispora albinea]|uniref:Uncharacterized protein n=1 Tax=Pendulispora albinea TaxID=2741071 RepID=A0ABZ2M839_9BACT